MGTKLSLTTEQRKCREELIARTAKRLKFDVSRGAYKNYCVAGLVAMWEYQKIIQRIKECERS